MLQRQIQPKGLALILFSLAVLVCAAYLQISLTYGPAGQASLPQFDTLMFHRYALAMAEGHPYRLDPARPATTASTSHLYPALLAVFCKAGLHGDALCTVGFALNAVFFLLSLGLVYRIAWRLDPAIAPLAFLLCLFNGQMSYSFFLLTNIGLFTVLALGALSAALEGRAAWLALWLALASFCRPEGLILSAVLVGVMLAVPGPAGSERRRARRLPIAGAIGVVCFLATLGLNRFLTGHFQFISLHNKGAFKAEGFWPAIYHATNIGAEFIRQGLFNMADAERSFYSFPILGGLLGLLGLCSRNWIRGKTSRVEIWWLACVVCALLMVTLSGGWQGLQQDKYWTWFLPVWAIYIAIGLRQAARRTRWPASGVALTLLLLVYQAFGLVHFLTLYGRQCSYGTHTALFCKELSRKIPPRAKIGSNGGCMLDYYMDGRNIANINGFESPQFIFDHYLLSNAERLRHHPELRFDYWLLFPPEAQTWVKPFVGEQLYADLPIFGTAEAVALYRADWSSLAPMTTPLSAAFRHPAALGRLIESFHVGDEEDEARCAYDVYTRIPGAEISPFLTTGKLEGRTLCEMGRVIIGSETLTLRGVTPRRAIKVVMRSSLKANGVIMGTTLQPHSQEFEFKPPLNLKLLINDVEAGQAKIETKAAPNDFFETSFTIPAASVTSERVALTVGGDHIAYAYWFYQ